VTRFNQSLGRGKWDLVILLFRHLHRNDLEIRDQALCDSGPIGPVLDGDSLDRLRKSFDHREGRTKRDGFACWLAWRWT
jgi:hypothetical protein